MSTASPKPRNTPLHLIRQHDRQSFIAGNNGAGDGIVDASSGTTSTAEPPQWQNVEVSNPRSETHGDAPRPPLQLKDIKVSANAAEASATISWNTEVQSDSEIVYGTAAPETGAVEWKPAQEEMDTIISIHESMTWIDAKVCRRIGGYLATMQRRKRLHRFIVFNNYCVSLVRSRKGRHMETGSR